MSDRRDKYTRFAGRTRALVGWDASFAKFDFSTGKWSVGKEDQDLTDCEVLADIGGLMEGFRKYTETTKSFAYAMVAVDSDDGIPARETLGDLDQERWPTPKNSRNGQRRDPWRRASALPMYVPEKPADAIVFVADASALDTIADLADAYAFRPGDREEVCRVVLGSQGPNAAGYYRPVLRIKEWVARPEEARRILPPPLPLPAPPAAQFDIPF